MLLRFLHNILGIPQRVAGTALRAKTGELAFEGKAWWRAFTLKIRILKSNLESGLLRLVMLDHHISNWDKYWEIKIITTGHYQ